MSEHQPHPESQSETGSLITGRVVAVDGFSEKLEILREDGPLLAVSKPAGLPTQGVPKHIPSLESLVRAYIQQAFAKPGNVYLGIPHRLDRPVSGVVVFARNSKAAARLAEQFRERTVTKIYRAIVEGVPIEDGGQLVHWLRKIPDHAAGEVCDPHTDGAKESRLSWQKLATDGKRSLLEVRLETGRMHQIRLQMAAIGHPITGDTTYLPLASGGRANLEGPAPNCILLHAARLSLKHPIRYDDITIDAPQPEDWPLS